MHPIFEYIPHQLEEQITNTNLLPLTWKRFQYLDPLGTSGATNSLSAFLHAKQSN